ncbi:MAG TPA: LysR family transcriptional regulator [Bauldia sp.]|nr:LysR family transcriptional regulator [Bauldia sp.]
MNWHALDLNLLRVLDAMLAERSTVRVGERVGLSQPAVSSALNRLRHALGDPLFVREGNRMVPTPFAEALATPLRRSLDQIEGALSGATFDPAKSTRTFRVLGEDFLAELVMPRLLTLMSEQAPLMRFQLLPLGPQPLPVQFADGAIDLAFAPATDTPDWIEHVAATRGVSATVASRRNVRLARAGLKDGDTIPMDLYLEMGHVLFAPNGVLSGSEDAALEKLGLKRNVVASVPQFFAVGRIAAQTQLVGSVPPPFARAIAERLELNVFHNPFDVVPTTLQLYWHRRHTDDPDHRWMRARLAELLAPLDLVHYPEWTAGGGKKARERRPRRPA